jgi:hypothetical protein
MKKERAYTQLFENLIRKRGWQFRQASKHEDMFDHIDCHVTVMNGSKAVRVCSIDLKGTKYTSRLNEGIPEFMCQYIEFLNVNGDLGWLFGKAEYIAVLDENEERFYLIKRKTLIAFCEKMFKVELSGTAEEIEEKLMNVATWVQRADLSHHQLYRRWKRFDIVTQISMDEVKELATIII